MRFTYQREGSGRGHRFHKPQKTEQKKNFVRLRKTMGTRGRKSKAELSVVKVKTTDIAPPPHEFSQEQQDEWNRMIVAMGAAGFTEVDRRQLESYCRHAITLRRVGQLITDHEKSEEFNVKTYDTLLKMQERESRCLASLSVRLGIAHTTGPNKGKGKGVTSRPWE